MPTDRPYPPLRTGFLSWCCGAVAAASLALACGAAEPGKEGEKEPPPEAEELTLPTTDNIEIGAWVYRVADDTEPVATVLVLHDLGGSHETVEPLAKALQAAPVPMPSSTSAPESVAASKSRWKWVQVPVVS